MDKLALSTYVWIIGTIVIDLDCMDNFAVPEHKRIKDDLHLFSSEAFHDTFTS